MPVNSICIAGNNPTDLVSRLISIHSDEIRHEIVGRIKKYLITRSRRGGLEAQQWLKTVFCVIPIELKSVTVEQAVRFYSFFFSRLYPVIREHIAFVCRVSILMDIDYAITELRPRISLTLFQSRRSEYLRSLAYCAAGAEYIDTPLHRVAREYLNTALGIVDDLVAHEPTENMFLEAQSRVYEKIGLLEKHSDPAAAQQWLLKSIAIREQLIKIDPVNQTWLHLLADACRQYGGWLGFSGNTDQKLESIRYFIKCARLYRRILVMSPSDIRCRLAYAVVLEKLGERRMIRQPTRALRLFRKSCRIREDLLDRIPDSPVLLDAYWVGCVKLGEAHFAVGNNDSACSLLTMAYKTAEELVNKDSGSARYNSIFAYSCLRLADVFELNSPGRSRDLLLLAHQHLERLSVSGFHSNDCVALHIQVLEYLINIDSKLDNDVDTIIWAFRMVLLKTRQEHRMAKISKNKEVSSGEKC